MPLELVSGPGPGKTPAAGTVTPGPARRAGNLALTCTVGDGQHFVITESDGAPVCQKCGAS